MAWNQAAKATVLVALMLFAGMAASAPAAAEESIWDTLRPGGGEGGWPYCTGIDPWEPHVELDCYVPP